MREMYGEQWERENRGSAGGYGRCSGKMWA